MYDDLVGGLSYVILNDPIKKEKFIKFLNSEKIKKLSYVRDDVEKQLIDYIRYINDSKYTDDMFTYDAFDTWLQRKESTPQGTFIQEEPKKKTNTKKTILKSAAVLSVAPLVPTTIGIGLIVFSIVVLFIIGVVVIIFALIGLLVVGLLIAFVWFLSGYIIYRRKPIYKSFKHMIVYTLLGPFGLFY